LNDDHEREHTYELMGRTKAFDTRDACLDVRRRGDFYAGREAGRWPCKDKSHSAYLRLITNYVHFLQEFLVY
jgi:hypothetical protein